MARPTLPSLQSALLVCVGVIALALGAGSLRDDYFWFTPDQLAYRHYQHGDYATALRQARNPLWRATACYRLGDYACAGAAFAGTDSPVADYNLGNAHARNGQLTEALADYARALKRQPDFPAALYNRRLIADLLEARKMRKQADEQGEEPSDEADDTVVDDKGKQGKPGQISIEKLDPKSLEKLWLRNVKTDPAAFLRLRFAGELNAGGAAR